MKTSEDIGDTAQWLDEHREFVDAAVSQGYSANIDGLRAYAARVARMEAVLHSVFEMLNGDWDPDDIDRRKLLCDVAELSGEEVPE